MMAVLVECFSVLVRNASLDLWYPGGHKALLAEGPNRMQCCDEHLSVFQFMHHHDREVFVRKLKARGLCEDGPDPDLALVRPGDSLSEQPGWFQMGRRAGHTFAWLAGQPVEPLVVPLAWRPGRVLFRTPEGVGRLEFEGRQDKVDVYRDPQTNQRFYVGRTTPEPLPSSPEETDASGRKALRLFEKGKKLVWPYLGFHEGPKADSSTPRARRSLQKGIKCLGEATARFPGAWNAFWILGMALRANGDAAGSLKAFEQSYDLDPSQKEVARQLGMAYLMLGRGAEAVQVNRRAAEENPDDAGLQANLGLALLVAGDVERALVVTADALSRAPDDSITRNLRNLILEVKAGRRARPTKIPF